MIEITDLGVTRVVDGLFQAVHVGYKINETQNTGAKLLRYKVVVTRADRRTMTRQRFGLDKAV